MILVRFVFSCAPILQSRNSDQHTRHNLHPLQCPSVSSTDLTDILRVVVMPRILFALLVLFCVSPRGRAADFPPGLQTLEIGDPAPDFKLPGIDGRDWGLQDFDDGKVLIVYFTSNHCPVCHAHDPRFMDLVREVEGKGVRVVAINPNSGDGLRPDELGYSMYDDSFEDMTPYAKDHGFTFPYLYDGDEQSTALA